MDAYSITSDKQREKIANILTGSDNVKQTQKDIEAQVEFDVSEKVKLQMEQMLCHVVVQRRN